MNLTKIISIVLFVCSVVLAGYLFFSIKSTMDFRDSIASTEAQIIDKLEVIREAEKVYLEQHGKYTSSWDTLINFIQNGVVPITVRKETIIPLSYGVDSVYVEIDTIGEIPAKDKIFKKTFTVSAHYDGTFLGYFVKEGDYVVKKTKSYKIQRADNGRIEELSFIEQGTVSSIADLEVGDQVKKGQFLISFWDYQLNPDVKVENLGVVPGSGGKKFEIFTAQMDRSGVKVSVIEVKDPAPINPDRKEDNEAKNRKPLRFGSRSDVSTAGNWE